MTDHPPTAEHRFAHTHDPPALERSFADLSPTVRTIAADAVVSRDYSVPVALCAIAGAVATHIEDEVATGTVLQRTADDTAPETPIERLEAASPPELEGVLEAISLLEAYAQIRVALLESDRYSGDEQRDAAILASDFLHAAAYEPIAGSVVPDRRASELYRVLAAGSSTLAVRFVHSEADAGTAQESSAVDADGANESIPPQAALGGIAATLGVTAVGASTEIRTALETYGQSLSAALCQAASESIPTDRHETTVCVLAGETESTHPDAGERCPGTETHLERAREACQTLEEYLGSTADRGPLASLERATRIPFHHEP